MNKHINLSHTPNRILIIAMRHLGDVLLCTPLISSLQQAYPKSQIDVLVFNRTAPILAGNPDIANIISISNKPKLTESIQLTKQIFRRYDLAVITQTGDRPFLYAYLASHTRISLVPDRQSKAWWKRYFVAGWTEFDDIHTHTVLQFLKLMDVINKPKVFPLTATAEKELSPPLPFNKYAILHLYPLWTYKRWSSDGWKQVIHYLLSLNINVVLTGGPDNGEIVYVNNIHKQVPNKVINLAGKTSLGQLSRLIRQATLYIGPDTGTTHLASATGTPTIALFGPSNPTKWAPWPSNYDSDLNPFSQKGNQQVNNVYLIQGEGDCVPCRLEGCEQHRNSRSKCLDNLAASKVTRIIDQILSSP